MSQAGYAPRAHGAPGDALTSPSVKRGAVQEAWNRHGAAMFALAVVLFNDTDTSDAEAVVLQAFLDSCTPVELACPPVSRHELARYVYVLWLRHGTAKRDMRALWTPMTRRRRPTGIAPRSRLSQLQRTTLALGLFGEHTYREIASLTEMAAPDVAALMRSGLLSTTDTRD